MSESRDEDDAARTAGRTLDRRAVLRRGAVLGGAVAWTTPVVQSLASPAFATGSALCETRVETDDCTLEYQDSPDCCHCVKEHPGLPLAETLALCAQQGACVKTLEVCGEEEEKPPPHEPPQHPPTTPPQSPPATPSTVAGAQASVPASVTASVPTVIPAGS